MATANDRMSNFLSDHFPFSMSYFIAHLSVDILPTRLVSSLHPEQDEEEIDSALGDIEKISRGMASIQCETYNRKTYSLCSAFLPLR